MYIGLKLKQFHKFETLINKIKNLRSNMKAWNNQSNETIERGGVSIVWVYCVKDEYDRKRRKWKKRKIYELFWNYQKFKGILVNMFGVWWKTCLAHPPWLEIIFWLPLIPFVTIQGKH